MRRVLVWLPVAFVLGGLVGRFGPSEALRACREAADRRQTAAVARSANGFDSFAALTSLPPAARRPRRTPAASRPSVTTGETAVATASATDKPPISRQTAERLDPEDLRARIEEAADLWRTRVELKRASTIERLGLDAKGAAAFDEALSGMNAKLRDVMQAMADALSAEGAEMTPELGTRLMGDLASALADTYDALGSALGPEARADVSSLALHEFIDPSVGEPLIAVQDRLVMPGLSGRDAP